MKVWSLNNVCNDYLAMMEYFGIVFFLTNVHFEHFIKIQNVNNLAGRKFVVFVFVHKASVQKRHQTNEYKKMREIMNKSRY